MGRLASRTVLRLSARTIRCSVQARAYATVTVPAGAPATGSVSAYDGSRRLTGALPKATHRGRATLVLPRLGVGRHSISRSYAGGSQVSPSRSSRVTTVVTR